VSAPFTSLRADVSCVPTLLAEGRGALATSFGLFQFMALYSTIQFANALLAVVFADSILSNNMFVWQDLFIVVVLSLTMGATPSARALSRKRPSANLLSPHALATAAGFVALTFAWQAAAAVDVAQQPWFGSADYPAAQPAADDAEGTNSRVPQTTSLFIMACFQLAACAALFAHGGPWKRSPLAANAPFAAWLALVVATSTALFFAPGPLAPLYAWLSLQRLPDAWLRRLFAATLLSAASYVALAAALAALRAAGACAALQRAAPCARCRRPRSEHRALADAWAAKLRAWAAGDEAAAAAGGWAGGRDAGGDDEAGAGDQAGAPLLRKGLGGSERASARERASG
jgi:magnesium-transporting ATPase (P-type)